MENCNDHCNSIVTFEMKWALRGHQIYRQIYSVPKFQPTRRDVSAETKHFQFRLFRRGSNKNYLLLSYDAYGCDLEPTAICIDVLRYESCANWIQANRSRVIPGEIFGAHAFLRGFVSDCGWSWRVLEREDFRTAFAVRKSADNRCLFNQAELRRMVFVFTRKNLPASFYCYAWTFTHEIVIFKFFEVRENITKYSYFKHSV